ncbi:MAG: hypothetical protein HY328_15130 [Chloroflexi bacterium]|nr:hypothetical protein [Chloroflexota bacterium]
MEQLRRGDMEKLTQDYWKKSGSYDDYCWYIENLLGKELTYAAQNPMDGEQPRLQGLGNKKVNTLALTVGDSFDPLLQVICVLRPKRVVLILNRNYSERAGDAQGKTLKRLILRLAQTSSLPTEYRPNLTADHIMPKVIETDTPTEVFRALRDAFRSTDDTAQTHQDIDDTTGEENTDAVDITGAKKSMVAGAFLYAAHSGLPITYVDFDSDAYHKTYHRPYGYACRIGEIANPYQAFRLRDWERVRQLYDRYDFRGAREFIQGSADGKLPGILTAMTNPLGEEVHNRTLYDPGEIGRVKRLVSVLEIYELWENGDFKHAHKIGQEAQPPVPNTLLPWAVNVLGTTWPGGFIFTNPNQSARQLLDEHLALKQGSSRPNDSLFAQPLHLLAYLLDELEKISRLYKQNEDYRSAYLRAAGLHEFLLKARFALCWLNGGLEAQVGRGDSWGALSDFGDQEHEAFKYMVNDANEWKLRQALRSNPPEPYSLKGGKVRRRADAPVMDGYDRGLALDLNGQVYGEGNDARPIFVKLRGEAIHTHLYIPRHVTDAALQLVQAAMLEFQQNWLEVYHPGTVAQKLPGDIGCPAWSVLCKELGLDFLPPRLRTAESIKEA